MIWCMLSVSLVAQMVKNLPAMQEKMWKCQSLSPDQLFSTPWSLPGSSVDGILQARILEWLAIPFSRGSSQPRHIRYSLSHQGSPQWRRSTLNLWVETVPWMESQRVRHNLETKYNNSIIIYHISLIVVTHILIHLATLLSVFFLFLFLRTKL